MGLFQVAAAALLYLSRFYFGKVGIVFRISLTSRPSYKLGKSESITQCIESVYSVSPRCAASGDNFGSSATSRVCMCFHIF